MPRGNSQKDFWALKQRARLEFLPCPIHLNFNFCLGDDVRREKKGFLRDLRTKLPYKHLNQIARLMIESNADMLRVQPLALQQLKFQPLTAFVLGHLICETSRTDQDGSKSVHFQETLPNYMTETTETVKHLSVSQKTQVHPRLEDP